MHLVRLAAGAARLVYPPHAQIGGIEHNRQVLLATGPERERLVEHERVRRASHGGHPCANRLPLERHREAVAVGYELCRVERQRTGLRDEVRRRDRVAVHVHDPHRGDGLERVVQLRPISRDDDR